MTELYEILLPARLKYLLFCTYIFISYIVNLFFSRVRIPVLCLNVLYMKCIYPIPGGNKESTTEEWHWMISIY